MDDTSTISTLEEEIAKVRVSLEQQSLEIVEGVSNWMRDWMPQEAKREFLICDREATIERARDLREKVAGAASNVQSSIAGQLQSEVQWPHTYPPTKRTGVKNQVLDGFVRYSSTLGGLLHSFNVLDEQFWKSSEFDTQGVRLTIAPVPPAEMTTLLNAYNAALGKLDNLNAKLDDARHRARIAQRNDLWDNSL